MRSGSESARLGAEVLRLTLKQVEAAYRETNQSLFQGRLRMPLLEWADSNRELGAWVHDQRCLRLSEGLLEGSWGELVEVLKHEMAHQYVDEVLGGGDEGPHGSLFRKVCAERGIDGRASGAPSKSDAAESSEVALLARIAGLLSLAQSDNRHEAEAAMAAARRLMLKYNLDEAVRSSARAYSFRHVGTPTGRRAAWQRVLGGILNEYFFVDVIIVPVYRPREGKRGSVLEIMGTTENLEMAVYVHDFLEHAADSLWRAHKRAGEIRGDKPRQSYLFGVMSGFRDKLAAEGREAQKNGLVWLGDPELKRYARARHPYVRSVGSSAKVQKDAFSAGCEAGRALVLHRGLSQGASSGGPRLLGNGGRRD